MPTNSMFSSLESTWDHSTRRGWTTLASFTMQAFALSMLTAISLIWVERPPQVQWIQLTTPGLFTRPTETPAQPGHNAANSAANSHPGQITAPLTVPRETARINDAGSDSSMADAPNIDVGAYGGPTVGVLPGPGGNYSVVVPPRPVAIKPLVVSHLAEANLLHRVQPIYPQIAQLAKIQGPVELRAVISKEGTIEGLTVVGGQPLLVESAMAAVRQWRYRPYLLNGEPIEVETDITVNFILAGR